MNQRPPLPGAGEKAASAAPLVTRTCQITWPGGGEVTAVIQTHFSIDDAPVHWSGATGKLEDPPHRTGPCILSAYLEDQAKLTGGHFTMKQDGLWPAMDEVTK